MLARLPRRRACPVTAAGGRSGVCGASVPRVRRRAPRPHRPGRHRRRRRREPRGRRPRRHVRPPPRGRRCAPTTGSPSATGPSRSTLSTVGGWLACRGAGQYSTRYGKIEDMVVGLDVVLADGAADHHRRLPPPGGGTRPHPGVRRLGGDARDHHGGPAAGPTRSRRPRAAPPTGSAPVDAGVDACRRILRRGATPAVLRLYDEVESQRSHGTDGTVAVLLVLDEAEARPGRRHDGDRRRGVRRARRDSTTRWSSSGSSTATTSPRSRRSRRRASSSTRWRSPRPGRRLPEIYRQATTALTAVPHTRVASAHLSHSYGDGACLYFTFAATPAAGRGRVDVRRALGRGHPRRARRRREPEPPPRRRRSTAAASSPRRWAAGAEVLRAIKAALDPAGILNPGKLGLPAPARSTPWP